MAYPYPASYMMGGASPYAMPPSPQPSYAHDPYHASRLGHNSRNPSPQPMSAAAAAAHSHAHTASLNSPVTSPTSANSVHATSTFMPQYGTYGSTGPAYGSAAAGGGYGAQQTSATTPGGASPYSGYGMPLGGGGGGGGGSPYGSSGSSHGHHNASYAASPIGGAGGYGQPPPQAGNSPSGYPLSGSHSPYGHAHNTGGSPYGQLNQGGGGAKSAGGSPYGAYPSTGGTFAKNPSPYHAPVYLPGASPDPYAHAHRAPPAATYATSPREAPPSSQAPSPYGHAHSPHTSSHVPSRAPPHSHSHSLSGGHSTPHSSHGHGHPSSHSHSHSLPYGGGGGHSHNMSLGHHSPVPPAPALAPPSPRMAYPNEPPSPRFSTDPSDAPNLLHPLVAYNDRVTPVDWNMRTAPSTHLRIPSTIQSSELVLAATAPGAHYIRLVSPLMPWFIPIEHPAQVSVMHVFEAVYAELQKPITQAEWRIAPERQREKVTEAYTERCAAYEDPEHERSLGIKRIDWLAKNTRFGGLRKDEDAAALKDSLTPYTFTLVCTTR